jgi:elongation factor Ts
MAPGRRYAPSSLLRRAAALSVSQGVVASYVHSSVTDGLGKIGVLVALESAGKADELRAMGRMIAMHVAAANPQAVDSAGLDPAVVAREKGVLADKAKASRKPAIPWRRCCWDFPPR